MSHQHLRRYVALAAFLALLAAPAWVTPVMVALAVAVTGFRVVQSAGRLLRRERRPVGGLIMLGNDARGRPITITERQLAAHGLIFGASGSGKTTALTTILEQQIRRGRPVVAIDMKGSPAFVLQLARAAAEAGRPFRLWTPDGPGHWNPVAHGNATELKDKLIGTERFTEPHYQRAAERYLQTVFQVLRHNHPDRAPTLAEVVALMDPRRLPAKLAGLPKPMVERVQDYLAGLTPDQLSAIRGLQTRLAIITESDSGRFLAPQKGATVDLPAALAGGEVVVFSLNSSRYGQFASQLGTLAVQDLISATGSRLEKLRAGQQLDQATIAVDEFSGIGGAHVVALFARGREAGVACLVATQEVADLDRLGRGVRDQILGNTAFKLVLRQEVPESAELVAQIAGTEKVWEETRQIGGSIFRGIPGGGTRREAERFIIHPNEIKSLRTGEAVLISKLGGGGAQTIRVSPPGRWPAEADRAGRRPASEPPPARATPSPTPPTSPQERAMTPPRGRVMAPPPRRANAQPGHSAPPPDRRSPARGSAGEPRDRRYPDPGVTL